MLLKKNILAVALIGFSGLCFAFPTTFTTTFNQAAPGLSSTYKSGKLRAPNYYDITCSNNQKDTCWGTVHDGPIGYWKCNSSNIPYTNIPAKDYHFLEHPKDVRLVQFNSLKAAEKDLGQQVCAQLVNKKDLNNTAN